jgi:hypothetical protein
MFGAAASIRHIAGTSGSLDGSSIATTGSASTRITAGDEALTASRRGSVGSTSGAASIRGNETAGETGASGEIGAGEGSGGTTKGG